MRRDGEVSDDGDSETVVALEEEFNAVNVMRRALMKKGLDRLVVVD